MAIVIAPPTNNGVVKLDRTRVAVAVADALEKPIWRRGLAGIVIPPAVDGVIESDRASVTVTRANVLEFPGRRICLTA